MGMSTSRVGRLYSDKFPRPTLAQCRHFGTARPDLPATLWPSVRPNSFTWDLPYLPHSHFVAHTHAQTDRLTDGQMYRQDGRRGRTDRRTDGQTDRQRDREDKTGQERQRLCV